MNLLRSLPASRFILWCAAWLVPGQERAEWLAEWQGGALAVMETFHPQTQGLFCGGTRSDRLLFWCFSGRFLAEMEQSRLDTAPGLPHRICVALFPFASYVDGNQSSDLFVAARCL